MKIRTVLCAEDGMVLTNGTDYGTVIWLAEGVSPDNYRSITRAEYEAAMADRETPLC